MSESDDNTPKPPHDDWQPRPDGELSSQGDMMRGQIRHQQIGARVPEEVARGVFSTGAIVLTARSEYCIDFVLRMSQPHQVAARVILPHAAMPQLVSTVETNLQRYRERFGEPPSLPAADAPARSTDNPLGEPTIQAAQPIQQNSAPGGPAGAGAGGVSGGTSQAGGAPNNSTPGGTTSAGGRTVQDVYDELRLPDSMLAGAYANSFVVSHSPSEFCIDFIANFYPRPVVSARVFFAMPQVPRLVEAFRNSIEDLARRRRQPPPPGGDEQSTA